MIKSKANYNFKLMTESEFECLIDFKVDNKIFDFIYNGALKKLHVAGDKTKVTNIKVPISRDYYNLINTSMAKIMNGVQKDVKPDGYKLLRYNVQDAYFIKTELLNIYVTLQGNYIKE
jgi:hypothetical protein